MGKRKTFPTGSVCKPCWELKYCPYGQLVELFPLPPIEHSPEEVQANYERILREFTSGNLKTENEVWSAVGALHYNSPWASEEIRGYDPEEIGCKVWGHTCPVFFVQSGATETREGRRSGRYIPREVMLKVVRRDNHHCQACHQYVPDNQIEFDHTIPVSRGGPTTVDNLKLYCRPCNRKKSNALTELLEEEITQDDDPTVNDPQTS